MVFVAADFSGILAGLDAGARGPADGLAGKCIVEAHAFSGHAIEIGCRSQRLAITATCIPALLVTEYENDVGSLAHDRRIRKRLLKPARNSTIDIGVTA